MRWLVIGLLISVAALLYVAGAVARHIWRQRRGHSLDSDMDAGPKIKPGTKTGPDTGEGL